MAVLEQTSYVGDVGGKGSYTLDVGTRGLTVRSKWSFGLLIADWLHVGRSPK